MMQTPIMRKLQALLNLANNAGTEGEALAAMNRLTKLCHDHDIEMAEIVIDEDKDPTEDLSFAEEVAGRQTSGWYRWQKDLFCAVATATDTIALGYGKTVLKFAGDVHDVAVAVAFWKQLQKTCRKLARQALGKGWTSDHKSWAAGFAKGCQGRAKENKEEMDVEDDIQGGAIVLYKGHKGNWLDEIRESKRYGEARAPRVENDWGLYLAGFEEGKQQNMDTQNMVEAE